MDPDSSKDRSVCVVLYHNVSSYFFRSPWYKKKRMLIGLGLIAPMIIVAIILGVTLRNRAKSSALSPMATVSSTNLVPPTATVSSNTMVPPTITVYSAVTVSPTTTPTESTTKMSQSKQLHFELYVTTSRDPCILHGAFDYLKRV